MAVSFRLCTKLMDLSSQMQFIALYNWTNTKDMKITLKIMFSVFFMEI